jgi:hypothetical protein
VASKYHKSPTSRVVTQWSRPWKPPSNKSGNFIVVPLDDKRWGGVTGEGLATLVSFNSYTLDVTPVEAYFRQYFIIQYGGTA